MAKQSRTALKRPVQQNRKIITRKLSPPSVFYLIFCQMGLFSVRVCEWLGVEVCVRPWNGLRFVAGTFWKLSRVFLCSCALIWNALFSFLFYLFTHAACMYVCLTLFWQSHVQVCSIRTYCALGSLFPNWAFVFRSKYSWNRVHTFLYPLLVE